MRRATIGSIGCRPAAYGVKFELQGFKTVERQDVVVNASFVATINAKLEVGALTETITVTGESPTVDVRSNVQQTVMNQEILEGVPTGRDPWSLAKIIPGVQVSTYDVGGTQSIQQSSLSSHGSNTNDVSYNIDGATVNWPGGGGGATMLYYDQGMFEEVNYMTSAIPAEVLAGGVSINMVTKVGRQSVARRPALQLRQRRPAVGELVRHAGAQPDVPGQPDQEDLRPEPRRRRRDRAEPDLGQRHLPQVGGQQAGQRPQPRRQPGARRQRPEELLGQGGRADQPEPQADRVVPLERQDPRPPPRHPAQHHGGHRLAGADQPGADDPGEVHGGLQPPGVRVELQRDGRPDQLHLPAGHADGAIRKVDNGPLGSVLRRDPRGAPAELAHAVRQHRVLQHEQGRRAPGQGRRAVRAGSTTSRTTR